MTDTALVADKIKEVKEEMRREGLWVNITPGWVREYGKRNINNAADFCEWLQFIYLPNIYTGNQVELSGNNNADEKNYIAPQAIKFLSSDVKKGRLLQLLIELDALV